MVRNICLYFRKRRANDFSVEVIKLVFCLVMVLFEKELISRMAIGWWIDVRHVSYWRADRPVGRPNAERTPSAAEVPI
jgi:hypothetical protein